MGDFITAALVALIAGYAGYQLYKSIRRTVKNEPGCGCGHESGEEGEAGGSLKSDIFCSSCTSDCSSCPSASRPKGRKAGDGEKKGSGKN